MRNSFIILDIGVAMREICIKRIKAFAQMAQQ